MSEQVINIRDRIEKMRTQMTGPKEAVARNEIGLDEKVENKNTHLIQKQNPPVEKIDLKKADELSSIKEKLVKVEKQKKRIKLKKKSVNHKNLTKRILNLTCHNLHLPVKLIKIITMITSLMKIKNL